MLKVKDLMSKKLIHLSSKNSMLDAARLMTEKNIRHVAIVDENKLIGIISDRDVQKAMRSDKENDYHLSLSLNSRQIIRDYMSWPVFTVSENTTIEKVLEEILRQKVSAFIVENKKGQMTGIITTEDLLGHFLIELKRIEEAS